MTSAARCRAWLAVAAAAVVAAPCAAAQEAARAAEPSATAALAALEAALVDSIASSEKSLVAVDRLRKEELEPDAALPIDTFRQFQERRAPFLPGDRQYVPNEYATGVVIDAAGLILTNYHVLAEGSEYHVTTSDRRRYKAAVHAADPRSDLAVLKIDERRLTPIKLGDGGAVRKGQIVVALGNPYAIARDGQASASWGIVSNLSRKAAAPLPDSVPLFSGTLHQLGTLIQTDARLNLGTSGGALMNLKGEMVGLTTSLAAGAGYEQAAGFAIPVDETFRRVIHTLKQGREVEYGFLGIVPSNPSQLDALSGRRGGAVDEVQPGTPAEQAELRRGDLITHVNGRAIHDADALMLEIGRQPAGAAVRLTVDRRGKLETLHAELAKFPVAGKKQFTVAAPAWRGLRVDYSTSMVELLSRQSPRTGGESYVAVAEVAPDSAAEKAGLRRRMLVTKVRGLTPGNKPREFTVQRPAEFYAAVEALAGPVELTLLSIKPEQVERVVRSVAAEEP